MEHKFFQKELKHISIETDIAEILNHIEWIDGEMGLESELKEEIKYFCNFLLTQSLKNENEQHLEDFSAGNLSETVSTFYKLVQEIREAILEDKLGLARRRLTKLSLYIGGFFMTYEDMFQ